MDLRENEVNIEAKLHSPDTSDDEDDPFFTPNVISSAKFCNKLRDQVKPLLSVIQKVTSPSKPFQENCDKPRESRAKKRLTRAKPEPPNGFIERRYGYVPNPRWPKPPNAYSKAYEPKGVNASDATGVQGVLFRNKQDFKTKSSGQNVSSDHSYVESEFPELNFSSGSRKTPTCVEKDVNTSTPSPVPLLSQVVTPLSPLVTGYTRKCVDRSQDISASKCQEFQSGHLASSPLVNQGISHSKNTTDSLLCSDISSPSPAACDKYRTTECNGTVTTLSREKRVTPSVCDVNHNNHSNTTWSSVIREGSPLNFKDRNYPADLNHLAITNYRKENKPTRLSDIMQHEAHISIASDSSQSPIMSWSNVVKISPSSGTERSSQKSTKEGINSVNIKSVNRADESQSWTQGKKHRKKKQKNNVNKSDTEYRQNMSMRNNPTQISLEDFVTPKKQTGVRKNMSLLENRFIEHIEANTTSPPKKVRPSPIKRLPFTKQNNGDQCFLDASGDAKNIAVHTNEPESFQILHTSTPKEKLKSKPSGVNVLNDPKQMSDKVGPILSLQSLLVKEKVACQEKKDVFEQENEEEDEYVKEKSAASLQAETFWKKKPVTPQQVNTSITKSNIPVDLSDDEDFPNLTLPCDRIQPDVEKTKEYVESDCADPSKVTWKNELTNLAKQYCYIIKEHLMPNLSAELYFIVQLLTCTDVDTDMLQHVDSHFGKTLFRSVHNGVYFAVRVIKRLKSLFLCLDNTYLELLACSERISLFCPKVHIFFKKASEKRKKVASIACSIGHNSFTPEEDGVFSFPDTNYAHVFKCQRDNFYAFYRHYYDKDSIYEFKMENQIQYVYDGCTPEQNSMFNLIHLANLFVEHMILCCVHQEKEKIDVIKMTQSKDLDHHMFQYFMASFKPTAGSCSTHCFTEDQMFFKDFLETLSCPAFNEHLRNILVQKILQLNSSSFGAARNVHSTQAVEDDSTPLRCHKFGTTVFSLCVLAKLLGHMTFSPYYTSSQILQPEYTASIRQMRELVPLPLPFHLLLKEAFDNGHLCLTIPWIVEFLSMMDPVAPQLSVYSSLLKKLHYIQRYSWLCLYKEGHVNTSVLIVSCISWLFENPSVPSGFYFSCDSSVEEKYFCDSGNNFRIDGQKLVSHHLISLCCPYLEQGHTLLVLCSLNERPIGRLREVLLEVSSVDVMAKPVTKKADEKLKELEEWLNSSMSLTPDMGSSSNCVIDDEVIPPYVLTRLVTSRDGNEIAELEANFIQNNPYVKSCVNMAVELITGKILDYTLRTILRVLVFEVKVEVRAQFEGISQGHLCDALKDKLLAQSYMTALRYVEKAKSSFFEVVNKCCSKELPQLVTFTLSGNDIEVQKCSISLAKKLVLEGVKEWAQVQIYPAFFQRIITKEIEKCNKSNPKHAGLFPSDFSRKLESVELNSGFEEMEHLSELIDKALSYGVWYINALTPGIRPDGTHMVNLIGDFIKCVEKRMVTMDFAFYVMSNFLMHLIIQYIVDAPQNWTDEAALSFLKLCHLCKARKLENDQQSIKLSEFSKKKKKMKVKVVNLMSVHSMVWLTKSEQINETLMAYCKLIYQLIVSELLYVETVYTKLMQARNNINVGLEVQRVVNQVLVKVLELLWETPVTAQTLSYSKERILTIVQEIASLDRSCDETTRHLLALVGTIFKHVLPASCSI